MIREGNGCGQYGEDRILGLVFQNQETGLLIDVGAADGYTNSNSIGLLKRPGWKGILIEPEFEQFDKLQDRYKNRSGVICVNCGIGMKEGERTLYCCGQASTFKEGAKQATEIRHNIQYTTQQQGMVKLTTLLDKLKVTDSIDFLSIDVEGMNYEVWKTLDKEKFSPKLICIEGKGYRMNGYRELCQMRGNTFYLKEDSCIIL